MGEMGLAFDDAVYALFISREMDDIHVAKVHGIVEGSDPARGVLVNGSFLAWTSYTSKGIRDMIAGAAPESGGDATLTLTTVFE